MQAHSEPGSATRRPWWHRWIGLMLVLHVLSAMALQAAPGLHAALHAAPAASGADGGDSGDDCLISLLQAGSLETVNGDCAIVTVAATGSTSHPRHSAPHLAPLARRLQPGRAPPIFA